MLDPKVETIGDLKAQLNHCRVELDKAVEQLKAAETQLSQVGDLSQGYIQSLRASLETTLQQFGPAVDKLAPLNNDDPLALHQDKLAHIATLFQQLESLQNLGS